jgi:hypothetical protein
MFLEGTRLEGVNPLQPGDRFRDPQPMPAGRTGRLIAVSCYGDHAAVYSPARGLGIRYTEGSGAITFRRLHPGAVQFLSWAPDDRHLAYRVGGTLFVLDTHSGKVRAILRLGREVIRGVAWDPWAHVLALALTAAGKGPQTSQVVVVDSDRGVHRAFPLPFTGASRIAWTQWPGNALGITRQTWRGVQAWLVTLPRLPPDPAQSIAGP